MTFRRLFLITSSLTFLLTQPAPCQTWQEQFDAVESLVERQQTDSVRSLLEQTVGLAETQFGRSDSTVDIGFFEDGASYRLYFGSFAHAESLYTRAVSVAEKALSRDDPLLSAYLRKLGGVYVTLGKYFEAKDTYLRALAAAEVAFGLDSKETMGILNDLGDVLYLLAEYEEADSAAKRALSICESTLGPDHPSAARSLEIIGQVLMSCDGEDDAEPLLKRSVTIREKGLGPDHLDVADGLRSLGECYQNMGRPDQARTAMTRSLRITEAALGSTHRVVALRRMLLARFARINFDSETDLEQLATEALTALESTYGLDHPWTAMALLYLASAELVELKLESAISRADKARPILERHLGPNHPTVILAYKVLSVSKFNLNQVSEAIELVEQIEARLLARVNPSKVTLAETFSDLYYTYWSTGFDAKADSVFKRACPLIEGVGDSRNDAELLIHVGSIYLWAGKTSEARALFERALTICTNVSGDTRLMELNIRSQMADSWRKDGEYDKFEENLRKVVPLSEDLFGPESVSHTVTLQALADLYLQQGKYQQAEEVLLRHLGLVEKAYGPEHQKTAWTCDYLAWTYAALERYDDALHYYERNLTTIWKMIRGVFRLSSETQKARYVSVYKPIIDDILSFAVFHETPESKQLVLEMILKGRAIVEETSLAERKVAYCSQDNSIRDHLDVLQETCTALANLALSRSADGDSLGILNSRLDSLESSLSRRCLEFEQELASRDFEISDLTASLPAGAILVEFIKYRRIKFDSSSYTHDPERPRYLALTLDANGEVSMYDPGPAATVDSLVSLSRDLIYDAQSVMHSTRAAVAEARLNEVTTRLRELVFDPLIPRLEGITSLYISPDGMLSLLPFEILPMPDSSYLIEKYQVSYLSSGRDLLRYRQPSGASDDVVVLADPDFENTADSVVTESSLPTTASAPVLDTAIHQLRGGEGCLDSPFGRLSHGLAEGRHVAESFRKSSKRPVTELFGPRASEAKLKGMDRGPGVLHIATHGYFCSNSEDLPPQYESPLLRAGLLLAGCNRSIVKNSEPINGEDGILTAFEVSGLNLDGTELVTLSACESGMSEGGSAGDGFYGLRRAFQHAGAQSVVMSLWSVPDRETRLLMEGFYDRWLSGSAKKDALRESALELLRTCREELGCGHPLLWGGFVLTGNPD